MQRNAVKLILSLMVIGFLAGCYSMEHKMHSDCEYGCDRAEEANMGGK